MRVGELGFVIDEEGGKDASMTALLERLLKRVKPCWIKASRRFQRSVRSGFTCSYETSCKSAR